MMWVRYRDVHLIFFFHISHTFDSIRWKSVGEMVGDRSLTMIFTNDMQINERTATVSAVLDIFSSVYGDYWSFVIIIIVQLLLWRRTFTFGKICIEKCASRCWIYIRRLVTAFARFDVVRKWLKLIYINTIDRFRIVDRRTSDWSDVSILGWKQK